MMIKNNKTNKQIFQSINGIMVIEGKHLQHRHGAQKNTQVWLYPKPYNWKVDNRTHHIQQAKVGRIATVKNYGGKSSIVITKIIHATGSTAIKMAKKLKYVVNFQNRKLKGHQIIKDSDKPTNHQRITLTRRIRFNNQQEARKLVRKMSKREVAKKLGVSVTTIYNWLKK